MQGYHDDNLPLVISIDEDVMAACDTIRIKAKFAQQGKVMICCIVAERGLFSSFSRSFLRLDIQRIPYSVRWRRRRANSMA